jgi:Trypsin-like peptidase domain
MKRSLILASAVLLAAATLSRRIAHGDETLVPGKQSRVVLRAKDGWRKQLALDVPADAIALRVKLAAHGAELALRGEWGDLPDDPHDASYEKETDGGLAELVIDRFGAHPLRRGRLQLELAWDGAGVPETSEKRLDTLECTIDTGLFHSSPGTALEPGKWIDDAIAPHQSGTRSYRLELPEGAHELRIDLDHVQGDLDLYARPGKPVGALDAGVRFARHLYGRESLVLGGDAPLGKEPWFIDVVDPTEEESPVGFRIGLHAGAEVPPELAAIPALPESFPGPLGKALPRVVELFADESTGSGTLLSPEGWILTNAHVVTAMGGGREKQLVVACTLDPHDPPLELFRAEVREFNETLDLALLQVTSGFYGQPLPAGYRFPTLELGDPAALAIGDPLLLVGYPSTGGLGSVVTLHCTRGIVSGFDHAAPGMVLKTDAGITGGNSGGAALDEHGKFVGVPTMMVELASGQAGYVHPWTWMPESWRKHLVASEKR